MLQTRNGKRTGAAMVRIAMEMLQQGMIDEKTALLRVAPDRLDDLLHPVFDAQALKDAKVLARGLPASPGPPRRWPPSAAGRWPTCWAR
jgi:pyruvate,orthophosphate dikinase